MHLLKLYVIGGGHLKCAIEMPVDDIIRHPPKATKKNISCYTMRKRIWLRLLKAR